MNHRSILRYFTSIFLIFLTFQLVAQDDAKSLLELSLEEILQTEVTTASGIGESILDAPATIVVVTAEEIENRGYTDLTEVVQDLPGFDISIPNGTQYMLSYQRGYRTPFTQRTLFLIDGKVDNHLWTHEAEITRQYPLSNIEKVEVLYGPASAVYGPNAFLGVINIITKDGKTLTEDKTEVDVSFQAGSFNTKSTDVALRGKKGDLSFAVSGKVFRSDEADLSDRWGFLSNDYYSDPAIWGPILDQEHRNQTFGAYADPTDDYGILGSLTYKNAKFGFINWERKEGYGAFYTADRTQSNTLWNKNSTQFYAEYQGDVNEKVKANSLLLYRTNRVFGNWTEATPDWNPGKADSSYINLSNWNSVSNSWLFKQNFESQVNENFALSGGLKFERKELTKAYDIPGYWQVFSSTVPASEPGPYGFGVGVGHSRDSVYVVAPPPSREMPSHNLALTDDIGGYVLAIIDAEPLRFNIGTRYDDNSLYGSSFNPRVSTILKFNEKGAIKALYGQAFQEPAPIQLWGGWNGRAANPDLRPEKARNIELVGMYQAGKALFDLSLYRASYEDVIKEEAENAGERTVTGAEFKVRYSFPNFIENSKDISGYLYYSYTKSTSSIYYDHANAVWEEGEVDLGDIAPNKINFGINLPIAKSANFNLRGNYVGERLVYSRNALRAKDYKIASYLTLNTTLIVKPTENLHVGLKVLNLTGAEYFHPGAEQADGGDAFFNEDGTRSRSLGFRNSLVPQAGRSLLFFFNMNL